MIEQGASKERKKRDRRRTTRIDDATLRNEGKGKNERRRVHVAKKTEKQTEIGSHMYRRVGKLKEDRVTAVAEMRRRKKNEGRCVNTIRARAAYKHVGKPSPTGIRARAHTHTHTRVCK